MDDKGRIVNALNVAYQCSQIDGDHHKAWAIDQIVRALCGTNEEYEAWVKEYENGGEYVWSTGIAP